MKKNLLNQIRVDSVSGTLFLTSAYGTGYVINKDKSVTLLWGIYHPEKKDSYTISLSNNELSLLDLNYASIAACTSNYSEIKSAIEKFLEVIRNKDNNQNFFELERLNGNDNEKVAVEIKTTFFSI